MLDVDSHLLLFLEASLPLHSLSSVIRTRDFRPSQSINGCNSFDIAAESANQVAAHDDALGYAVVELRE